MNIKSFKTQILLFYILFMFLNSVLPAFGSNNLWRWDKTIHFVEFFILGYLFINALIDKKLHRYKFLIGLLILTLIPVVDEGLQFVFDIPGRVADFYDFVVDIIGAYCGALLFLLIYKIRGKNG